MSCTAGRATRLYIRNPYSPIVHAGCGDYGIITLYLALSCRIRKILVAIRTMPILDIADIYASRVDGSNVLQICMFAALIGHTRRKNERQKHRGYQYYRNRYTRFSSLHNDSPHAIITCKFLRYISYATLF